MSIYRSDDFIMVKEKEFLDYKDDSELFNFWIYMASYKPSKVAIAISECVTPDQYRKALKTLKDQESMNVDNQK